MRQRAGLIAAIAIGIALAVWLLWTGGEVPAPPAHQREALPPAAEGKPDSQTQSPHEPIRARPFDPGEEAAPSPGSEEGLLVTVVNTENQPVKSAVIAACDPSAPSSPLANSSFPKAVTRSDGSARIRVDVPLDVAHLIVLAHGHVPALVRVQSPSRQRVTLEGEALLRGKVLVNGRPPRSPLSLRLQGYSDPTHDWGEGLRAFRERHGFGPTQIPFDTDASGEFAVRGLIRGESCVIGLPEGYVFAATGSYSHGGIVRSDGTPVTLELSTMNALTGRVVAAKGSKPKPGASEIRLWYILQVPGGAASFETSIPVELGQPFRIHFVEPEITSVTLQVWEGGYPGRRVARKTIEQKITGSKDLGDIVLDEPTMVTFLVKDLAGQPIVDARVLAFGHVSPRSSPDGRTTLGIYPGIRAVVVGAPRFRIEGFSLPEKLPAMMEVTLDPGCMIIVRVRNEDPGEPVRGLEVAVAYEVDDVAAAADSSSEFGDVRIGLPIRSSRQPTSRSGTIGIHGERPGHQTHWYDVKPGEDIVVSGFKKEDEPRVRVGDRYGGVLLDQGASFADDNIRAMEMVVRSRPKTIRGTVLGDRGGPLRGARVVISSRPETEVHSDAFGNFELPAVYLPDPTLIVSAHRHVTQTLQGPQIFDSPTIILDRGRRLLVHLTGPSTEGMEGRAVLESEGGARREVNKRTPDTFVFHGVPCRPGTLRVIGRNSEVSLPIGAEETRVEVARPE